MTQQQEFLTASQLAGLPGLPTTARGVSHRAAIEKWPARQRIGRGGGSEYPVACLPPETQLALAATFVAAAPAPSSSDRNAGGFSSAGCDERAGGAAVAARVPGDSPGPRTSDPREESLARMYEAKSEKQKRAARAALDAVAQYHELTAKGIKATLAAATVAQARAISAATLSRHLAKVKGRPGDLWLFLLVPGYQGRTVHADMSAEAWEILKAAYLSKPARAASACIESLREANRAGGMGWVLPSDRTMERRLLKIPRDVRVLARKGRDELLRLYPPQQRSKSALAALDIVNGDGYSHKHIWVEFEDGEIRRAKTWFWQDVYSSKILAWRTDKTEHTELIRLSFGDLVQTFGIPRAVLIDNTRAAANKTMSGGVPHRYRFKVLAEEVDGVFKLMRIERVMWATPGHGQAKPVERIFGIGGMHEYVDKAPDFAGSFDDSEKYNGKTRPVPVKQLEAVIAREVAAMNARLDRRGAIHQGRSWDAVFADSYERATIRRATDEQRRLWLLCSEPTKVHRDGSIVLDAGRMVGEHRANRYWSRELGEYVGKLVAARFDPARLHEGVHLYTADGRYIAFGECLDPAGFNDGNAAREHARDRGHFIKATRVALEAERRMSARQAGETLANARASSGTPSSIPAPKVIEAVFRDPLERPQFVAPERSAEDTADLARLEAEIAAPAEVNVLELRSDADKHAHWKALNARRAAGAALGERDEEFWQHWQTQDYHRFAVEAEAEFEQGLETRRIA